MTIIVAEQKNLRLSAKSKVDSIIGASCPYNKRDMLERVSSGGKT
jgi:hypothetical protein